MSERRVELVTADEATTRRLAKPPFDAIAVEGGYRSGDTDTLTECHACDPHAGVSDRISSLIPRSFETGAPP